MPLEFKWTLRLRSTAASLWEHVSDTNRVNRNAGLPEFHYRYIPVADGGSRQEGETRFFGLTLRWDESPFEWIEGRTFDVVRQYLNGPVSRFRTTVTLTPDGGGCILTQVIAAEMRWFWAVPLVYWEIAYASRRRFEATYRGIDQSLQTSAPVPDAGSVRLPIPEGRLESVCSRIRGRCESPWLQRLTDAIEREPDEALDLMRPYSYADRWRAPREEVLRLFLIAAEAGLLQLSWDLICPSCRDAKTRVNSLRDLRIEAHCDACNIRYDADFARSVEVNFRPAPAIRSVQVARYCSGGPMNAPHVAIQQVLAPGESRRLRMDLANGNYRIRSLQLPGETTLILASGGEERQELILNASGFPAGPVRLKADGDLELRNATGRQITLMIERPADSDRAARAATVIAMQEFRSLFSGEVLAPDVPVSVGAVCIMFTDLKSSTRMYEEIGEAPAFGLVRRHFDVLREGIAATDGAIVKTIGDAVMAVWMDPADALRGAFDMHHRLRQDNLARMTPPALSLKIGVHFAPCIAATSNDVLDYFGTAVNLAARIQKESLGDDIVVTEDIWLDARVQEVLGRHACRTERIQTEIRGLSGVKTVYRITPQFSGEPATSD